MHEVNRDKPPLENVIESEGIGLKFLIPGRFTITEQLARAKAAN